MIWFTSDTHFGHKNIIEYCNRPYRSVKGMNESLVRRWNHMVKPNDIVYHLGDVSFLRQEFTTPILEKLNGGIYLIKGNHDRNWKAKNIIATFLECHLNHDGQDIYMTHHPHPTWPFEAQGGWHLHGHTHGNPPHDGWQANRMDVGVDPRGYRPISIVEVKEHMDGLTKRAPVEA